MVAEIAGIREKRHKMGFYQGWEEMLIKDNKNISARKSQGFEIKGPWA